MTITNSPKSKYIPITKEREVIKKFIRKKIDWHWKKYKQNKQTIALESFNNYLNIVCELEEKEPI